MVVQNSSFLERLRQRRLNILSDQAKCQSKNDRNIKTNIVYLHALSNTVQCVGFALKRCTHAHVYILSCYSPNNISKGEANPSYEQTTARLV